MTKPVQTQITDEIGLRLANLSVANGYTVDLVKLERARLTPFKNGDLPACNYWAGSDRKLGGGAGYIERSFDCVVEIHTVTRDRPFSDVSYELATDIQIAIDRATASPAVSDNPSTALGGMVQSLDIESIIPSIGEGQNPWCGVVLSIYVKYKIKKTDPFTLIS